MSDEPRPCLRLFFSVDIAGSTAYKNQSQGRANGRPHWLALYEAFFEEFSVWFANEWTDLRGGGPPAEIWKLAGDEILMSQELRRIDDAWAAVRAFKKAVYGYQERLRTKYDRSLGLKGTVWCAGFPVINSEIEVKGSATESDAPIVRDYIGPTIDAGFRLARHATPARIVLSPEMAWLLSKQVEVSGETMIGIYYDGDVELKGVFGGRPVPLFTIDAGDPLEKTRNAISGRKAAQNDAIIAFVESFAQAIQNPTLMTLPYLTNDDGSVWGIQPLEHVAEFSDMYKLWEQESCDNAQWEERASEGGEVDLAAPSLRAE